MLVPHHIQLVPSFFFFPLALKQPESTTGYHVCLMGSKKNSRALSRWQTTKLMCHGKILARCSYEQSRMWKFFQVCLRGVNIFSFSIMLFHGLSSWCCILSWLHQLQDGLCNQQATQLHTMESFFMIKCLAKWVLCYGIKSVLVESHTGLLLISMT